MTEIHTFMSLDGVHTGEPRVDLEGGDTTLRIWPCGVLGPYLVMGVADWEALCAAVQTARDEAGAVRR